LFYGQFGVKTVHHLAFVLQPKEEMQLYMCVPSSLTSCCMTSSILSLGLRKEVGCVLTPVRISRWEPVCKSA